MGNWIRSFQGRWLNVALLAVVLVVIGVQFANPHSYVSEAVARIGETGSGPDAKLTDLTSMDPLRANFSRDSGHPRLILLLSPTLPTCAAGASWVRSNILDKYPSSDVRVDVVWFDMLPGDSRRLVDRKVLNDHRVANYYPNRVVGSS